MTAERVQSYFSKFAFLFLIFAVISGGFVSEVLSCQMQKFLSTSQYGRHMIGLLMVFVFIMLEGGWSFDTETNDMAENDWSSGNVIETLVMASLIYALFLLSSKSKLIPNAIFFVLLFSLYAINTQRAFWHARKMISDQTNNRTIIVQYIIFIAAAIALVYGFTDYVSYQKSAYGPDFSWSKFFLGSIKCSGLKDPN